MNRQYSCFKEKKELLGLRGIRHAFADAEKEKECRVEGKVRTTARAKI
jgi:hypothetical protein